MDLKVIIIMLIVAAGMYYFFMKKGYHNHEMWVGKGEWKNATSELLRKLIINHDNPSDIDEVAIIEANIENVFTPTMRNRLI